MKYEGREIEVYKSASRFEKVYSVQWRGNGVEEMAFVLLKPQPYLAWLSYIYTKLLKRALNLSVDSQNRSILNRLKL